MVEAAAFNRPTTRLPTMKLRTISERRPMVRKATSRFSFGKTASVAEWICDFHVSMK